MIGTFSSVLAIFTLYLTLFPTPGAFVPLAYTATLVMLGGGVHFLGASRIHFLALTTFLLVLIGVLSGVTGVSTFYQFGLFYGASAALALLVLHLLPGGRTVWTSALLVTLLFLMLEAHYFLDSTYIATLWHSITLVTALGFLSTALLVALSRSAVVLAGRRHRSQSPIPRRPVRPLR